MVSLSRLSLKRGVTTPVRLTWINKVCRGNIWCVCVCVCAHVLCLHAGPLGQLLLMEVGKKLPSVHTGHRRLSGTLDSVSPPSCVCFLSLKHKHSFLSSCPNIKAHLRTKTKTYNAPTPFKTNVKINVRGLASFNPSTLIVLFSLFFLVTLEIDNFLSYFPSWTGHKTQLVRAR